MTSSAIITCHLESIYFHYNKTFDAFSYYLISFSFSATKKIKHKYEKYNMAKYKY